jgi:hypothetical protein
VFEDSGAKVDNWAYRIRVARFITKLHQEELRDLCFS